MGAEGSTVFLQFLETNKDRFSGQRLKYRVFFKKDFHKRGEKMQEKMKMTKKNDNNLVQVQQQ